MTALEEWDEFFEKYACTIASQEHARLPNRLIVCAPEDLERTKQLWRDMGLKVEGDPIEPIPEDRIKRAYEGL
jgi:hypothetical protein